MKNDRPVRGYSRYFNSARSRSQQEQIHTIRHTVEGEFQLTWMNRQNFHQSNWSLRNCMDLKDSRLRLVVRLSWIPMVATRHGGGAFSGKDATKLRPVQPLMQLGYIAKNIVAAGLPEGRSLALSCGAACFVRIDTLAIGTVAESKLESSASNL